MKHWLPLTLLALALAPSPLSARYLPPALENLLGASDLVAVGTISHVQEAAYFLDLEKVIVGSPSSSTIRIQRFEDWPCSQRWLPYSEGERVWIMVQAVEREDFDYALRSAGSESEFPVLDHKVLVQGYAIPDLETMELARSGSVPAIPLEVLEEVTLDLRRCWAGLGDSLPEPRCSADEIQNLLDKSPTHRRLLEGLPRGEL